MNKQQHVFVWTGIALITFMAIVFESKLIWVIAAIALTAESVYLCKGKELSSRKLVLLVLAIIIFFIALTITVSSQHKPHRRPGATSVW